MIRRLLIGIGQTRDAAVSALEHNKTAAASAFQFASTSIREESCSFVARRKMSSGGSRDLFYDDIVKLSSKKEIILIDVREPGEIQETGILPGSSANIPVGDVGNALNMDPAAFKQKYGFEKPGEDAPVVFSCRSGKRSYAALGRALALGFSKSRHYAGGWLDWEKHTKQ